MSESGDVIMYTLMTSSQRLSFSSDDTICLADWPAGIYQSKDDGVSCSLVFKGNKRCCWQATKVITGCQEDFWTLEQSASKCRLRVYSLDGKMSNDSKTATWKDVVPRLNNDKQLNLMDSRLSYDGNKSIFLSDWTNIFMSCQ